MPKGIDTPLRQRPDPAVLQGIVLRGHLEAWTEYHLVALGSKRITNLWRHGVPVCVL